MSFNGHRKYFYDTCICDDPLYVQTNISMTQSNQSANSFMSLFQSYSMQIYFRQRWVDKRLSFYLPNITELSLSNRFIQNIWKPNSYFLNGRDSKQHNLTVPNAFVRLSHNGSIYISMRSPFCFSDSLFVSLVGFAFLFLVCFWFFLHCFRWDFIFKGKRVQYCFRFYLYSC